VPEPAPGAFAPDAEPLPEPLFFGPDGPLGGRSGDRISLFTDCPDGPECRRARLAGVEAAMAVERAGGNYEAQRIVAEATFLARLPVSEREEVRRQVRALSAFPAFSETLEMITELALRGGRDAEAAARLQYLLLRAEFRARGIRVGY
jgi:hypothetical protein